MKITSVDGDFTCTWDEFKTANEDGFDQEQFDDIENALKTDGVYSVPSGGMAGFTIWKVKDA